MVKQMNKNIIFDFGNVLGKFDIDCLTEPYVDTKEELEEIRDVVFDRYYWDRLDRDEITDREVIEDFCRKLPKELHKKAINVYENWVNTMTPVPYMTTLVHDLKAKCYKLYLLSNISLGFANTYHTVPWIRNLFSLFDGLVLSATVGMSKPDREIFQYILDKYSIQAEETLFIDDNQGNLDSAAKLGIHTYLFDWDVSKLRNFLE